MKGGLDKWRERRARGRGSETRGVLGGEDKERRLVQFFTNLRRGPLSYQKFSNFSEILDFII